MNTNRNKKSFAARANELIRKYSRASFDKTEADELEAALASLAQEQEAYKQANGIGEYGQQQQNQPGMPQFSNGGPMTVSQLYTQRTGKPWSTARASGLTDGTAAANLKLQQRLLAGEFDVAQPAVNQAIQPAAQLTQPVQQPAQAQPGAVVAQQPARQIAQEQPQFMPQQPEYLRGMSFNEQPQVQAASGIQQPIVGSDVGSAMNMPAITAPSTIDAYNAQFAPSWIKDVQASGIPDPTIRLSAIKSGVENSVASASAMGTPEIPETTIARTQGILPSALSGGISAIGNLAMGLTTKPYQYNKSYGAEQVSFAPERERLSREAATARNIAGRNMRSAGSRGSYMAGVGAASAGLNQQFGDALSHSYQREGMLNLQQRERANELNRGVDMLNYQARTQADQDRRGYFSNAINSITGAGTDINRIMMQNALIESLGSQNYMVSPSTSKKGRDLWLGRTIKGKVRPQ